MSVDTPTRQQPTPPPPPSRSGFNPVTLFIAAISAVVAAVVVSKLWPNGTLWATAMTPVLVSLIKEGLERPAQKIGEVTVVPRRAPRPEYRDELVVEEVEPGPDEPEPAGYKFYGARKHAWRIAVITGLLAFVVAAAALTLPELVAGRSVVSGGKKTTIFRGHSSKAQKTTTTETTTTPATTTPQGEQPTTTTPPPTETVPPETTTTPPAETTPPEQQTAPPEQQTAPATPPPTP